jgi:2-C-methyl-D-erythritol 2,4-cyclodiphosphate synthase
MRIGHGFDVHKFGGNGPIVIGGVSIPHQQGLLAHSDGDVLLHALSDAILGAASMGDIGQHFPDNDQKYKNIDSRVLLRHVVKLIKSKGWVLVNADITIVAQAPKMSAYIPAMRECIRLDTESVLDCINVKATTTEKLGYTGRKEGSACHAVVLITRS